MANQIHDTGPITLINVFEIRPDDVELFLHEFAVAAHPAVYRVVIEATAE
jgi:hypothetical protein